MPNLVFIGSDNIGDAFLTYQVIDAITSKIPPLDVYLYHKNSFNAKILFQKHPNIKKLDIITTKIKFSKLLESTKNLYQNIQTLLESGDVYISSLLGSGTIVLLLKPLLIWNKLFGKNKVILLTIKPLLNGNIAQHILQFHYDVFSKTFDIKIQGNGNHPLLQPQSSQLQNISIKTIVFVCGASSIWKCWPAQKFIHVISYFLKHGYTIKLLGGKSDVDISQSKEIMKHFDNESNIMNLVGKTTLIDYFAEIQKAWYIITNDSSAQHIANACGVPCTVIWGRNYHDCVVHAYSYKNDQTLNIFNKPYITTSVTKIIIMLTRKNPSRSKKCIIANYNAISCEDVCSQVENHIKTLNI